MRRVIVTPDPTPAFSRRALLVGALAAGGLAIGWTLWPRRHVPFLPVADREHALSGYVKIGEDGHVTIIMPQSEFGQGNMTLIAQIVADELGADWRTIAVEPAPVSPFYANPALGATWQDGLFGFVPDIQGNDERLDLTPLEPALRKAGAAARILLCKAAAAQWDVSWKNCNTLDGFVIEGSSKAHFGDLAAAATQESLPDTLPLRAGKRPLIGQSLPRLDVPAKLDGSLTYAADIRLPDMVYVAIRHGPAAGATLAGHDAKAAEQTPGYAGLVASDTWLAVAANSWWAAERALDAAKPRFVNRLNAVSEKQVRAALAAAQEEGGDVWDSVGDTDALLSTGKPFERQYSAHGAPHFGLETPAAAVGINGDQMQLWIATNQPAAARRAAAEAAGLAEDAVFVHALQGGGSFGRCAEVDVAAQAATIAVKLGRPVLLQYSRTEAILQNRLRPAASARIAAKIGAGGRIEALRLALATTDALAELKARHANPSDILGGQQAAQGSTGNDASDWYRPPYSLPAYSVEIHATDQKIPAGLMRGGPAGFSCFFIESFIDEVAKQSGIDPFSIRMGMLAGNPRLALCLSRVSTRAGWTGGAQGTGQGLACFQQGESRIAVFAEARFDENQRVRVSKLVAVADVGRMVNPDIALQQMEGGLMHGLALATGAPVKITEGGPNMRTLGALKLPRLGDMPDISIEIVSSAEPSGPLGEIALPPVAPAIANAIASASGQRLRILPLGSS